MNIYKKSDIPAHLQKYFEPAATDRASKLYFEADFPLILDALVWHIEQVQARAAA